MTVVNDAELIETRPSGAALGAEIKGVDLSQPLSAQAFARIEDELHAHGVIYIRDQAIDDARFLAFSHLFGPELDIHPFRQYAKPDHPEIFILSNIIENGRQIGALDAAQYWHTDLSYTTHPSRVSILYALEIPVQDERALGNTEFASAAAAYDALPAAMKARLQGLRAAHLAEKPKVRTSGFMRPLDAGTKSRLAPVVHPVVRTHPFTGRKCLYVNEGFTTHIVDIERAESDTLLAELFARQTRAEFVHAHSWRAGDVVMMDNCLCIHQGIGDYALPLRRRIHRTIVKGSVPF